MIWWPRVPDSRAASMKVCSRMARVPLRATRPKAGMLKMASAQMTCSSLGPRPSAMASASTSAGNAISTSSVREMVVSTGPRQ
jgi:hypothetical protein